MLRMESQTALRCVPSSAEHKANLAKEIADCEQSTKFKEKTREVELAEKKVLANHQLIDKHLRANALMPGCSVLELGCAAGKMLQMVKMAHDSEGAKVGMHKEMVGVELVSGWVKFAQKFLKPKGIDVFEGTSCFFVVLLHSFIVCSCFSESPPPGDIADFTLPGPHESKTFDFVMLNDVAKHIQKDRCGCFFSQLQKVTHDDSIVHMHTPNPQGQLMEKGQFYENVLPHHFLTLGMATAGFELIQLEQDLGVMCGARQDSLSPSLLLKVPCACNKWPRHHHVLFRRVNASKHDVFQLS
jgi:3-hydroxymyristoyl/3-hydroxydecanoyl-(acyl carrier protein) dehydratase